MKLIYYSMLIMQKIRGIQDNWWNISLPDAKNAASVSTYRLKWLNMNNKENGWKVWQSILN